MFEGQLHVYFKYSTVKRSPWGFTFTPDEQILLHERAQKMSVVIGLICGGDGVAALSYDNYLSVAALRSTALRISCRRNHREHFEIGGPDGILPDKVAPSDWAILLTKEEKAV